MSVVADLIADNCIVSPYTK